MKFAKQALLATCPCCGSQVPEKNLPDETLVADFLDRYQMAPSAAWLFFLLFRARGRTVPYVDILDHLSFANGLGDVTGDALRTTAKRLRQAMRRNQMPCNLRSVSKIGYRLECEPGWHWRDRLQVRAKVRSVEKFIGPAELPPHATKILRKEKL